MLHVWVRSHARRRLLTPALRSSGTGRPRLVVLECAVLIIRREPLATRSPPAAAASARVDRLWAVLFFRLQEGIRYRLGAVRRADQDQQRTSHHHQAQRPSCLLAFLIWTGSLSSAMCPAQSMP